MKLKDLNKDVVFYICQMLDTLDLLSFFLSHESVSHLANFKLIFSQRAKHYRIYDSDYRKLDANQIKTRIVAHMRAIYRDVRSVCSKRVTPDIFRMMLEDDSKELIERLHPQARCSARALMPIAIKFSRLHVMHGLLNFFQIGGSYIWLMHAIREEQYDAVKYLVEVIKVPLLSTEEHALLPSKNKSWDPDYQLSSKSGRRYASTFRSYNELLLHEIIRCKHPKIVTYLRKKLDETIRENIKKSDPIPDELLHSFGGLFKKIRRHSVEGVKMRTLRDSPDLRTFQC